MSELKLIIGTKGLSSWSLRPWLLMKQHQLPFSEIIVDLDQPGTRDAILRYSPSATVPALIDGETRVWDSLAICEYLAERHSLPHAWPKDPEARAYARSVSAEMHAGFSALRQQLPFDATRRPQAVPLGEAVKTDISRIQKIWSEARQRFGGDGEWLFGRFGIADAMFAPVAMRFHSYAVALDTGAQQYVRSVVTSAAVREWVGGAFLDPMASAAKPSMPASVPPTEAPRPAATANGTPPVKAASAPTATPVAPPKTPGARKDPDITIKSYIIPD